MRHSRIGPADLKPGAIACATAQKLTNVLLAASNATPLGQHLTKIQSSRTRTGNADVNSELWLWQDAMIRPHQFRRRACRSDLAMTLPISTSRKHPLF